MKRCVIAVAVPAVLGCCGISAADVDADMTVNSGSTATVNMRLDVSTFIGSSNDNSTRTASVTGGADAVLGPGDVEPFTSIEITDLDMDLSNTSFYFEFYCVPIFGCSIDAELSVSNFNLGVSESISAGIAGNGNATFNNAPFNPNFSFNADIGGLIDANFSGNFNETTQQTFGCNVQAANQSVSVQGLSIDQVVFEIDPSTLPSGVTANVDLGNVGMSGSYDPPPPPACPGDFNDDGLVDGGDFGVLLATWGKCKGCPEDLDGNGQVDGGDVGLFLSSWGACP